MEAFLDAAGESVSRRELEEHDGGAVDVGGVRGLLTLEDFGGRVGGREGASRGGFGLEPRAAEVEEHEPSSVLDAEVRVFDVAVHQRALSEPREHVEELGCEVLEAHRV